MRPFKNVGIVLACALLGFGQFGCETTKNLLSSTQFSESAYNTSKQLKADSLALIDRAKNKTPYSNVAADVDALMAKIDNAIAMEQGRAKSGPTAEQWKQIRGQLSKLFDKWKTKGALLPAMAAQSKIQVAESFDLLLKTEADKPRKS